MNLRDLVKQPSGKGAKNAEFGVVFLPLRSLRLRCPHFCDLCGLLRKYLCV